VSTFVAVRSFRIRILVFAGLFLAGWVQAQEVTILQDLQADARKYVDGEYRRVEGRGALPTVYFLLDASAYPGAYLQLHATRAFDLFINGKLAATNMQDGMYGLDSLKIQFASPELIVAVRQEAGSARAVRARVVNMARPVIPPGVAIEARTAFRDFAVVAALMLLILFIIVVRLNPKLTTDYFSINRIFSLREMDDNQIYSRITSSANILFYVFCSLMGGFCLTIIFQFTSVTPVDTGNFGILFLTWIQLSIVVLALFFFKILLVYSLSGLFGMRGIAGVHFFYWIRVLLLMACVLTVVLFLYFISRGQSVGIYEAMIWIITIVLMIMMVFVFLKLTRRADCSFFHLFSYICATELIPLLITIKLLHQ
jgi:hypothetical protein